MTHPLIPVILAGGSGTRLWPLSRKNFPKQFLRLQGEQSLLQETVDRVALLQPSELVIVSNEAHYFLCQEQLQSHALKPHYLLEPCARNTAPAIASAAHFIAQQFGPDAVMLILPSDHWIGDNPAWQQAMQQGALLAAAEDVIVTYGIKPSSPKTGYGYIEADTQTIQGAHRIASFREKPDEKSAQRFVSSQHYFWNSGMFVCRAATYLTELERFAPSMNTLSEKAVSSGNLHHDFLRLETEAFSHCDDISIDYAVMEKTEKAVVIPLDLPWSDLGCWTAVAEANKPDEHGNTLHGNVIAKESRDCLISSEDTLVTALGVCDHIIVATRDAVLVADKRFSQQVKDLVRELPSAQGQLAEDHPRVFRPWGYYEVLVAGETFKVKRLMVKPGAKLSLQMHQHRAEHWVVVAGSAEVVNDDKLLRLAANQSTYIPPRTKHRLSNPGQEPLFVIEVQSGSYLGEDDITRYDDVYAREQLS